MTRSCFFFFARGPSVQVSTKTDEGIQIDLIEELVTLGCAPGQKLLAEDSFEFGESRGFEFAGSRVSQVTVDGGLDSDARFFLIAMARRRSRGNDSERFVCMNWRGTGRPFELTAILLGFLPTPRLRTDAQELAAMCTPNPFGTPAAPPVLVLDLGAIRGVGGYRQTASRPPETRLKDGLS
jgi:hypothetical protein